MNVLVLTHRSSPERRTQVSRLGTDSFILARGRKSRLKEREHGSLERVKGAKSNYFRRNQMATVTYRGVKYDSKEYNAKVLAQAEQARNHDLMYRGLKVVRKVAGGK